MSSLENYSVLKDIDEIDHFIYRIEHFINETDGFKIRVRKKSENLDHEKAFALIRRHILQYPCVAALGLDCDISAGEQQFFDMLVAVRDELKRTYFK